MILSGHNEKQLEFSRYLQNIYNAGATPRQAVRVGRPALGQIDAILTALLETNLKR